MAIVYDYFGGLYINLTNRCPCRCEFCIKNFTSGLGTADSLMLDEEPTVEEVKEELARWSVPSYDEVIFCGYGEPTCEFEILKSTALFIRGICRTPIRLNTNGLGNLINKREIAPELKGLVDTVSISLNASTSEAYDAVTRPSFKGVNCFEEMLKFAKQVKEYVPNTMLTVGDVIGKEEIAKSQAIADSVGIKLRVREYEA